MIRKIKQLAAVAAVALSMISGGAQAQSVEGLFIGIGTEIFRAALRQAEPIGPLNAAQARQVAVNLRMAPSGDVGVRTVDAPVGGFWLTGNPAWSDFAPTLVSHDGKYVLQLAGQNSVMLERLQGGGTRQLTQQESQDLLVKMLASLRPEAVIAYSGNVSPLSPLVISAPNCPACVELDRAMRPHPDLGVRLVPTMLGRDAMLAHSRIMCQPSPRAAFDVTIDARGRVYPPNVQNCDLRMEHQVLTEMLWMASGAMPHQRTVPAFFKADGRRISVDWSTPANLRASIQRATITESSNQ